MASQSIGFGDGVPNDVNVESVPSEDDEQFLSPSSFATREDIDELKTLFMQMHQQLLGKFPDNHNEKSEKYDLSPSSSLSVASVSVSTAQASSSSSQESQASFPCANCEKNERLLKERDEAIATLLSDVLQRLWATRGDPFPKEVGHGANGLGSTKDLARRCDASGDRFKGIPQQQKELGLFDKVLPLIIRQQGLKSNGCIDWGQLWPLILNCRSVCKSWKRSVDALLENDSSHLQVCSRIGTSPVTNIAHYTPRPANLQLGVDGRTPYPNQNWIPSFTTYFKEQQALDRSYNPIPSRHLLLGILQVFCRKSRSTFSSQVSNYLESFGAQVRHLTLHGSRLFSKAVGTEVYEYLNMCLQYLPNLKSLSFDIYDTGNNALMGKELLPFPHFNQLVTVNLEENSILGIQIIRSNTHIQRLRVSNSIRCDFHADMILEMGLDNLTELSFPIGSLGQMRKLANVTWKLRKLCLSFPTMSKGHCSIDMVVTMVETFRNSLDHLTLDVKYPQVLGRLGETPLKLPRLKHLHITYTQKYTRRITWGNLFKELRQLETLEIVMSQVQDDIRHPQRSVGREQAFWRYIDNVDSVVHWTNFSLLRSVRLTVEKKRYGKDKRVQHILRRRGMPTLKFDVKFSESCMDSYS